MYTFFGKIRMSPLQVQGLLSCLWITGRAVVSSSPTADPVAQFIIEITLKDL